MRTKIINIIVASLFLLLILTLLNMQVIQSARFKNLSDRNCIRLLPQEGNRGNILDRNGEVIVDSQVSYDAMIMPQPSAELQNSLALMASILGKNPAQLIGRYKKNYVASFAPVLIATNIDPKKAIALEEVKTDSNGIIIQPRVSRHYPYGDLACHLLGYLNEIDTWRLTKLADYGYQTKDLVGFGGVEERYDYYLRPKKGGLSIEVDHLGRSTRTLGFRPPVGGKEIRLTLELRLQKIVEEALKGRKGSVVVMAPFTGEILAMASAPGFNPLIFLEKSGTSIKDVFSDKDAPLINRAISATYPPGSIFKIVVASAGLETSKINLGTRFNCTGGINLGKQHFACWEPHGEQDIILAIAHSCNVFFYRSGLLTGAQNIHDYATRFALSRTTSIDLPYEAGGFVPNPLWKKIYKFQSWFDGDTVNLSIGQGEVLVTPLQMARLIAVFANGGFLVNPYIVSSIDGQENPLHKVHPSRVGLKGSTIDNIRKGLREVVLDDRGTAHVLASLPISVAGKTGTAQAPPGQPHAWFVGFFPYESPAFVISVVLEHGGPGYVSSVVAKEIISRMLQEGLIDNG